jgi:hypothetical protein
MGGTLVPKIFVVKTMRVFGASPFAAAILEHRFE